MWCVFVCLCDVFVWCVYVVCLCGVFVCVSVVCVVCLCGVSVWYVCVWFGFAEPGEHSGQEQGLPLVECPHLLGQEQIKTENFGHCLDIANSLLPPFHTWFSFHYYSVIYR